MPMRAVDKRRLEDRLATHSGLALGSNELKLGTPTTINTSTTNSVAASSHTHAVT